MLAIISDLHLTDGSSGEIISDSAFRLFRNRLSDMAYDASWRCDTDNSKPYYKPIESMDILLLGDILDMIRSEQWDKVSADDMPWADSLSDTFYDIADRIVDGILDFNKSSFEILKDISVKGINIPGRMEPAPMEKKMAERIENEAIGQANVTVRIHYMIGNHDWFFCLGGARMQATRRKVIDALGLCHDPALPFPFYRYDNPAILAVQDAHRVFAEHGDEYDPTNYQAPHRDKSSIGDAVVIKILNAIPRRVNDCLEAHGSTLDQGKVKAFIKDLQELDNLRPYGLAADWIAQKMKEVDLDAHVINDAIRQTLREVITGFRECPLVAKDHKLAIEMLLPGLLLGFDFNIGALSAVLNHSSITRDKPETYRTFAMAMAERQEKDFFIMGHTHYAEVVPLYNYTDTNDSIQRSKIYINTGTWREVHFKAFGKNDFISYKTMAIAGFYKGNERKRRPFEFWTGYLAI